MIDIPQLGYRGGEIVASPQRGSLKGGEAGSNRHPSLCVGGISTNNENEDVPGVCSCLGGVWWEDERTKRKRKGPYFVGLFWYVFRCLKECEPRFFMGF